MGQGAKERHKSFVAQGFAGGCGTRTRGGSYDNKLRAHEKRIVEIEAKKRGVLADQEKHAVRITGDRVTRIRASRKGGGGPLAPKTTEGR